MSDEMYPGESAPANPYAAGESRRVVSEAPCRGCGYNLYGLAENGTCPECGESIAESLKGTWLYLCDPRWLQTLKMGITLQLAAIIVGIALSCVGFAVSWASMANSVGSAGQMPSMGPMMIVSILTNLVTTVLWVIGLWKVTSPDTTFPDVGLSARSLCRWTGVPGLSVSVITTFISNLLTWAMFSSLSSGGPAAPVSPVLSAVTAIVQVIGFGASILILTSFFAQLVMLRKLALRMPDAGLAKQTKIVLWGIVGTMVGSIALGLVMFAVLAGVTPGPGGQGGPPPALGFTGLLVCPVFVAMLVFGIWWIVLMVLYQGRFGQQAIKARSHRAEARPAFG